MTLNQPVLGRHRRPGGRADRATHRSGIARGHGHAAVSSAPMSDRTLVLLKPDTVERKLVGEVISRFEAKNLDVVAMDLRRLDADTLARHYEEHVGKGFYDDLVSFMSRGPVVAMVIEGPEDTWEVVRKMMGATNPRNAEPGTIRGDLGILFTENLVHGSDSLASGRTRDRYLLPELVTLQACATLVVQTDAQPVERRSTRWHVATR